MKIAIAMPPNFGEIVAALPEARGPLTVFCYGDTIYNPGGGRVTAALKAHESVHSVRQGDTEQTIREWWRNYIASAKFRLDEELPAHRAEYAFFCGQERDKEKRHRFLVQTAQRLSGPLYGGLISFDTAKHAIKDQANA